MNRVVLLLAIVLVAPFASADDMVIYAEESGRFEAGLVEPVEGVNAHSLVVVPVENHTRLRFQVGFDPAGVAVQTAAVEGTLYFRLYLDLADAETGEPLPGGRIRLDRPGTVSYQAEGPVRATLWLQQGAGVGWTMRVSALPDPVVIG